ncbi:MAG TPA: FtsX-like permease family protein [Noviherbaspirillum sp.]|jgi:putative ABC transport system permease protein|uniref:FtsX-like permease family protein n=1 Tax=Noviherbaspirillum sp. TaxID=1926288 RepID=UPI002F94AEAB
MMPPRGPGIGASLLFGEWRSHPLRVLLAVGAIAAGVALGFAIHLINAAAYNEFSAALKSLSGQSDLQVRGVQPLIDEAVYVRLLQRPEVEVASPVLEIDAGVAGRQEALKILGIDVFQAAAIAPDLVGMPAEDRPFDTLADDAVFLSPAAMEWLGLQQGDMLRVRAADGILSLRVAGGLVRTRPGQRLAVMDIGAAQWRFGRVGMLSRVELKLKAGADRAQVRRTLAGELAPRYLVAEPQDQEARTANMSRAYRVNLNVLALVGLFTGAFLVFSTQALSVIRRRSQLALLRVLGMTRRQVLLQILMEGAGAGVAGSLLGLAAGYAMAAAALQLFGGDLGGGYFPGVQPSARFAPGAATLFFLAGTTVALLGCALPAWEAARARPAQALKAGAEDVALSRLSTPWPALACIGCAVLLARMPPWHDLPVPGYLAIALLLVGGIGLMPRIAAAVFGWMAGTAVAQAGPVRALSLARLANAPNQASIALGGVLSSFSLMVAMVIMVASFRVSVDDWLSEVLAADLYLRSAAAGNSATLGPAEQQAVAATAGVARAEFLRSQPLVLDPARPPVTLIARPIDAADPARTIPVTGDVLAPDRFPAGALPVWVSEAMVDLYRHVPGTEVRLMLGGREHAFIVAGVWRDYARQTGAIQMRLSDYRKLTGDQEVNDGALWLQPGARPSQVIAALRALPFGEGLELAEPGEIRAVSLRIFDRSFAVTYLLEAVAIVIGLFGVGATFSSQALARAKEFGMLRHVGVLRRQILAMLALEGSLLTLLGVAAGFVLGTAISLILVFVVNPQSFHWTMRLHMPWAILSGVALVLLLAAAATALLAGRHAVSGAAVQAVREDW